MVRADGLFVCAAGDSRVYCARVLLTAPDTRNPSGGGISSNASLKKKERTEVILFLV